MNVKTLFSWSTKFHGMLGNAKLTKSRDFNLNGRNFFMHVWYIYERSRFYYEQSKYIVKGRNFIMNSRNMLCMVKIFFWTVKIFMVADRSRFSWWLFEILWTVGIFMTTGSLRFSCWLLEILWTVGIFMMADRDFNMNGRDFYDDRTMFSWWKVEIFMMTGQVLKSRL